MKFYSIADKVISIDSEIPYYYPNLESFEIKSELADLNIKIKSNNTITRPMIKPIINSQYLTVYKVNESFQLFYKEQYTAISALYNCKTKSGTIYLQNKSENIRIDNSISYNSNLTPMDYIFFCIRDLFLIFIQQNNILAIHSSSIIYKEKAFLFSASSGTGKTTHTNMWVKNYGVEILDGDITAISIENGVAYAYGLPWCGTSQKYLNKKVPLGGIIFLHRSSNNTIDTLDYFESTLRLSARCFTPTWTSEQVQTNLDLSEKFVNLIPCFSLGCLPNEESVKIVKERIDTL